MTAFADVASVLSRAGLGAPLVAERAGAGERNDVWLVDCGDQGGEVVVRFLVEDDRLEMEVTVIAEAGRAGVPVADVLWAEGGERPVMVQRRLPGRRLADAEPTDALLRSVAQTLRIIHSITAPAFFGNLRVPGDTEAKSKGTAAVALRGEAAGLGEWFIDRVRAEADAMLSELRLDCPVADRRLLEKSLSALEHARRVLDRQPAGLAHGDFSPANVLVAGDLVTGVLDWEAAKGGPPALDFGWWDWLSVATGTPWPTDALIDAYDPDRSLARDELAALRRLVVHRVWTRELVAGLRHGNTARRAAARAGLAAADQLR